jgi:hypothetical protein
MIHSNPKPVKVTMAPQCHDIDNGALERAAFRGVRLYFSTPTNLKTGPQPGARRSVAVVSLALRGWED